MRTWSDATDRELRHFGMCLKPELLLVTCRERASACGDFTTHNFASDAGVSATRCGNDYDHAIAAILVPASNSTLLSSLMLSLICRTVDPFISKQRLSCRSMRSAWQRRLWMTLALLGLLLGGTREAAAQSPSTRLRLGGIAISSLKRPLPGKLVTFRTVVSNTGEAEQSALVLARLAQAPTFQAAAEVTVPGGESRSVDLRLRIPSNLAAGSLIDLSVSLNSKEAGERVLLSPSGQPIIDSLGVRIDGETFVTATMLDKEPQQPPEWVWPADTDAMSYELLVATRIDSQLSRRTLTIGHEQLPAELADWEGVDALVIARDDPLRDPVALASLGSWLAAGGRLLSRRAPPSRPCGCASRRR